MISLSQFSASSLPSPLLPQIPFKRTLSQFLKMHQLPHVLLCQQSSHRHKRKGVDLTLVFLPEYLHDHLSPCKKSLGNGNGSKKSLPMFTYDFVWLSVILQMLLIGVSNAVKYHRRSFLLQRQCEDVVNLDLFGSKPH